MNMRRVLFGVSCALALSVALTGCQELETTNTNLPDIERAFSEPGDVENLIAGSFQNWMSATHWNEPSQALITMADASSCSWGNFGMRDMSSEPRQTLVNTTGYGNKAVYETPWYGIYASISSVNDGLRLIQGGLQIGQGGRDNARARAFAKFVQGISHGYLAMLFDQAFVFDETIDLNTDQLTFAGYQNVAAAAVAQLEACIDICNANTFTLPETWINGLPLTNVELAQVARSYAARILADVARDPNERSQVNWSKVIQLAENGVTSDFAPAGDGAQIWWSSVHWYNQQVGGGVSNTWHRADYKLVGPADKSGGYQNWLATPVGDRQEFVMTDVDDRRISPGTYETGAVGKYFGLVGGSPFPSDRGTYHYSRYAHGRYGYFPATGGNGPMPLIVPAELKLLIAEGLLWTGGDLNRALSLINETRVANGELPALTATTPLGSVNDDPNPNLGLGGTIWSALKHEKLIEAHCTSPGLEYSNRRAWGDMVAGTPIHLPVPAKELEVLQEEVYTWGGVGRPGGAPKRAQQRVSVSVQPY